MHQVPVSASLTPPDPPPRGFELGKNNSSKLRKRLKAAVCGIGIVTTCGVTGVALFSKRCCREDNFTSRPRINHTALTALCGAFGECASVVVTYPIETIKVRCQTNHATALQVLRSLFSKNPPGAAFGALYCGVLPAAVTAMATGAAYLTLFGTIQNLAERTARRFGGNSAAETGTSGQAGSEWRESSVAVASFAAATASLIIACLELPTEVVRLRMQSGVNPGSFVDHMRGAWRDVASAGWLAYLAPSLIKDVPHDAMEFAAYGKLTRIWDDTMPTKADDTLWADWAIGAAAGAAACLVTMPADVMKTRLSCVSRASFRPGPVECLRSYVSAAAVVYQERGMPGFFAGMGPRMMKVPSTMVYWVTVEATRRLLQRVCVTDEEEQSRREEPEAATGGGARRGGGHGEF